MGTPSSAAASAPPAQAFIKVRLFMDRMLPLTCPMVPQDIPADILAFLSQRIDSVPQLGAVIMMGGRAARAWTVEDVAWRTYASVAAARSVLEALQRRGFLAVDEP